MAETHDKERAITLPINLSLCIKIDTNYPKYNSLSSRNKNPVVYQIKAWKRNLKTQEQKFNLQVSRLLKSKATYQSVTAESYNSWLKILTVIIGSDLYFQVMDLEKNKVEITIFSLLPSSSPLKHKQTPSCSSQNGYNIWN